MVAWKAAQSQPKPTELIRLWHEHLYGGIERLKRGVLSRCSNARHEGPKNPVDVRGVDHHDFTAMVREDAEAQSPAPQIEAA